MPQALGLLLQTPGPVAQGAGVAGLSLEVDGGSNAHLDAALPLAENLPR